MDLCLIADGGSILASIGYYSWIVIKVLIGLGLVIFVHELGHFLVAKACGVKCEKFYLGFDVPIRIGPIRLPRTLGKFTWGETEYGIGIVPLGGYVKMLGQDDNPARAQEEADRIRVQKSEPDGITPEGEQQYELDPRSFPAKSVPQRMAIISAGVIMNLIFAVILAAVAYRMGVKYEPCEIGSTTPGSPAWVQDLPLGSQIVQLGANGRRNDHLRFLWDLKQYVFMCDSDQKPVDLVLRTPDGAERDVSLVPEDRLVKLKLDKMPTIGVGAVDTTTLDSDTPVIPYLPAGHAEPAFEANDRIVGIGGEQFSTEVRNEKGDIPAYTLRQALAAHSDQPLTFQVERETESAGSKSSPHIVDITVQPTARREVGLQMKIGAVEAIRNDSPAARAGVQIGDVLVAINDQPIGDPLVLPQRIKPWIGQSIPLTVRRKVEGKTTEVQLEIAPEDRFQLHERLPVGHLVALEPMGVAFAVENTVANVAPGSPAAKAGLRGGDVLTTAHFTFLTDEAKEQVETVFRDVELFQEPTKFLPEVTTWPAVDELLQKLPEDTQLHVTFERAGESLKAEMNPVVSDQWYATTRGLLLTQLSRIHEATSWTESWQLGYRETRERFMDVIDFVRKLFTAKISLSNVGGPVAIAAVAGKEASEGIPRLLIFLTFLSANLAVLNFLPYPALDGGHMVFLTAEAVMGKPVNERIQGTLTLVAAVVLLAFFVFVAVNDVGRFFQ